MFLIIFDLFLLIIDRTIGFEFLIVLDKSNSTLIQNNLDTSTSNFL